mmetsp:Transcript_55782/g.122179  ORF Transcript_55782/g.122179 Transcript_55782/m.122179 type:complete len:325 (-) Transcript_55782:384-1358(-)
MIPGITVTCAQGCQTGMGSVRSFGAWLAGRTGVSRRSTRPTRGGGARACATAEACWRMSTGGNTTGTSSTASSTGSANFGKFLRSSRSSTASRRTRAASRRGSATARVNALSWAMRARCAGSEGIFKKTTSSARASCGMRTTSWSTMGAGPTIAFAAPSTPWSLRPGTTTTVTSTSGGVRTARARSTSPPVTTADSGRMTCTVLGISRTVSWRVAFRGRTPQRTSWTSSMSSSRARSPKATCITTAAGSRTACVIAAAKSPFSTTTTMVIRPTTRSWLSSTRGSGETGRRTEWARWSSTMETSCIPGHLPRGSAGPQLTVRLVR